MVHECYGYQSNRLDETKQRMYFSVEIFETEEVFCTKKRFWEALEKLHVCYGYQSNRINETKQRMYFSVEIFET